jgi:hypothetical protein
MLEDGRLLVAGGAATLNVPVGHAIGLDSEVWDAETNQWQVLAADLRFEGNQRLHLNQLPDGRVLFFASREEKAGAKPDYQARLWNPASNTVQVLPVAIKPAAGTDIAVLNDGWVLIVNGLEGSADFWDSIANRVMHTEVPLLENLRWRILAQASGQVLLLEAVPDVPLEGKKAAEHSATVRWDADEKDEWKRIGDLPVAFKQSAPLEETEDGAAKVTVDGLVYLLPEGETEWHEAGKAVPPPLAAGENVPASSVAATAAATQATTESSWWDKYLRAMDDAKWSILALSIPIFLYIALKYMDNQGAVRLQWYLDKLLLLIAGTCALSLVVWLVHDAGDAYASEAIARHASECMKEESAAAAGQRLPQRAKGWARCVDDKNGWVEDLYFRSAKRWLTEPVLPCQYVGRWISVRGGSRYLVTFTDDGRFTSVPQQISDFYGMAPLPKHSQTTSGSWSVADGSMVWLYDTGLTWPIEVRRIDVADRHYFALSERGTWATSFQLDEGLPAKNCSL